MRAHRRLLPFAVSCLALALGPWSASAGELLPEGADFGAGLTLRKPVELVDVLETPARYAGEPILLRGRISDVCQRKGCWTVLRHGDAYVRVRFKDYGFFLPKDCSGKQALVEGVLSVQELNAADARHYAGESKTETERKSTAPRREIAMTASGVRLIESD